MVATTRVHDAVRVGAGPQLKHLLAVFGGLGLSRAFHEYPFGDAPAPLEYSLIASLAVIAFAIVRPTPRVTLPLSLLLLIWAMPVLYSLAPGSTWAILTWFPLIFAAALLSALSPAFLLAVTGITLFEYAGTLVILKHEMMAAQGSGSVPYFLGFVGVVGAFLWLGLAHAMRHSGLWSWAATVLACVFAAGGAWMALASGSRASVLGLLVGAGVSTLAVLVRQRSRAGGMRRAVILTTVVLLLVPVLDYCLTSFYAPGATSTMMPVLDQQSQATQSELRGSSTGGSFGTRLEFWKQAWIALKARPLGHGLGSYPHVNHHYQQKPMLWSGSPHNFVALTAVETGIPGLLALFTVMVLAAYRTFRWRPSLLGALTASAAILSLDIFSSQPIQYLLWWAVLGAALAARPAQRPPGRESGTSSIRILVAALVLLSSAAAARFAVPCQAGCEPIERYAGLPRMLGGTLEELQGAADPRWAEWERLYPFAFWLRQARAEAMAREGSLDGYMDLLERFPYQSADTYVRVASELTDRQQAGLVAACGLERIFSGETIWLDQRSSLEHLDEARLSLEALAAEVSALDATSPCVGMAGSN